MSHLRPALHPRLSALAVVVLAALAGVAVPRDGWGAATSVRLGTAVVPKSQSIQLGLDANRKDYTGSTRIQIEVRESTSSFRLHAEDMTLAKVGLRGVAANGTPKGEPIDVQFETHDDLLEIHTTSKLTPGLYVLDIEFTKPYGTKATGLYRMEHEGKGYLFTQFEADEAREAFPCFDEPGFKIPWQLTAVVPDEHLVLFNTPIEKETREGGKRTVVFEATPPLPSYLVALASGPLETVDIPGCGIPTRVVTVAGQKHLTKHAVEMTPPLLRACERWFDQKYPFKKLDLVAVPEYWYGAMENPGAITFAANILLLDPETASTAQRRRLARTNSHELAHMWFGDYVTMQWWDDLWLNESFADWLGDKITEEVYPEFGMATSELLQIHSVMSNDVRPSAHAIRRPVEATENLLQNVGTQYNKGKCVLGMCEQWIGVENFRKGVLAYVRKHAWSNATASDLWSALAEVSGRDVTGVLASFIDQPGLPLIRVEPAANGGFEVSQERLHNFGVELPAQTWKIPVVLDISDGKTVHTETVLLDGSSRHWKPTKVKKAAWVMPNAESRGYYRWTVPAAMRNALLENPTANMSPRERIGFLGNLSALLEAGVIHGDEYLEAMTHFAADPEPQVIAALAGNLVKVEGAFAPAGMEEPLAAYVQRCLNPSYERWGFEPRAGEPEAVTLVRPRVLEWLGDQGRDPQVLEHATKLAPTVLAKPAAIDGSIVETVLELTAIGGDRALYDEYKRRFEAARTPVERAQFLNALGSFRDPAIATDALRYALEGPLRPNELGSIAADQMTTPAGRERAFKWMTDNWNTIAARVPKEFASGYVGLAAGCDEARLEAARQFFADPSRDSVGIRTSLTRLGDATADCLRLREREGARGAAYLSQLVGAEPRGRKAAAPGSGSAAGVR